jgi:hypothetical protein
MAKHLEPCAEAMKGSEPLFQKWTEKILKKYEKSNNKNQ